MATFLVERYWPGVTAAAAEAATASLGGESGRGPIVVVETIVAASDEVCFWYVEAVTEGEITTAFRAAGIPIDRIGPATALPDLHRVRRPAADSRPARPRP